MNREDLYYNYIENNARIYLKLIGIQLGNTPKLVFEGTDTYENKVILEIEITGRHNLGDRMMYLGEQIQLKDIEINEYTDTILYIKEQGKNNFIELYDWVYRG